MIVTCDHCSARYRLDESKIPGRGARVTCPSCRHVFVVYRREGTQPAAVASSASEAAAPPAPSRPSIEEEAASLDVSTLDFRSVGIASWKVKVKIGLIYDFNDYKTFTKNIRDGRVTATDLISFDGSEWSPIGDTNNLSQRFCEVFVRAQRATEEGAEGDDELGEDEPTRIMSAPDTGASVIGPSASPASAAVLEAPEPAASEPSAGPSVSMGSDSAIADALASAAAEVDGEESWKSGKSASNQPPRFVDPFDKGKSKRSSASRRTSTTATAQPEEGGSGGTWLVAAVVLIGLGLGGYWFINQNSNAEVTSPTNPEQPTSTNLQDDPGGNNADEIKQNLLERLEQNAEPVEAIEEDPTKDEWGNDIEPELRPVIPEEFRNDNTPTPEQNGSMSVQNQTPSGYAEEGDRKAASADWAGAAASYKSAVGLDPGNARYQVRLCEFQYRSGNVTSARSTCGRAKQAGMAAASKWLGHIAYDQGDMSGAVGHYQTYLSSNPADRSEIQRRIDAISGG